jgi:hypothetical protein
MIKDSVFITVPTRIMVYVMKIDEYGNSTTICFENYDNITIPGIHHFEIGSDFKLADGHSVIISGYTHLRHRAEKASFGKIRRRGWVVNEIIGIGTINPRGISGGFVK